MVVGLLDNKSFYSNRFTLVYLKSENDVRLQATLGSKNPTGLPVGVVSLSGYDDFSYAQAALRYSVKDYLLKPISSEALLESLQRILITLGAESEELQAYSFKENALNQQAIANLLQNYLQENYHREISLRELGDRFGFTQEYLGKIFKKYTGETLSKYLTKLRMNEAKRLLLNNPEMSIQSIGEMVGYKDDFYFSRAFKNYTGIQPSKFRKQMSLPIDIDDRRLVGS